MWRKVTTTGIAPAGYTLRAGRQNPEIVDDGRVRMVTTRDPWTVATWLGIARSACARAREGERILDGDGSFLLAEDANALGGLRSVIGELRVACEILGEWAEVNVLRLFGSDSPTVVVIRDLVNRSENLLVFAGMVVVGEEIAD